MFHVTDPTSPWVEITPYFGRAEISDVIGEKLFEMLKFPAPESYCFTLMSSGTRQEIIKNNMNTE